MLVLLLSKRREGNSDSLLLGGVMVNAFCGAIIMFLISVSKTAQMQKIIFWLMGDLSSAGTDTLPLLVGVLPCFVLIFLLAQPLNLLLTGRESASSMGVNVAVMIRITSYNVCYTKLLRLCKKTTLAASFSRIVLTDMMLMSVPFSLWSAPRSSKNVWPYKGSP